MTVTMQVRPVEKPREPSMCPGRMYINGSIPLLKEAPTKEVLSKLLKEGMTVTVQVRPVEKPRELKFVLNNGETTAVDLLGFRTNDGEHRKVKTAETSQSRMVGWMVAVLWVGEKPDFWELNTHGHRFESHEAGFTSRLSSAHNDMFKDTAEDVSGKEGAGEGEGEAENGGGGGGDPHGDWFLVSGSTKVNSETGEIMTLPPLPASFPTPTSRVKATVKGLHRPSGGSLDCGEDGVFTFSRGVVYTEQGLLLGHTTVLETVVREGQEVQVDLYVGEVVGVYPGDVPEEQETHKDTVMS